VRRWREFEAESPVLAGAGRRLLVGADGVAIAFLATASRGGIPHVAPVCPIFCKERLFLSAPVSTPKARDLRENPRYALHAFLGANDEEFQLQGTVAELESALERAEVLGAIEFGSFDSKHPIFEFSISRALWVVWERVGQPDTRAVRRSWVASSGAAR